MKIKRINKRKGITIFEKTDGSISWELFGKISRKDIKFYLTFIEENLLNFQNEDIKRWKNIGYFLGEGCYDKTKSKRNNKKNI